MEGHVEPHVFKIVFRKFTELHPKQNVAELHKVQGDTHETQVLVAEA